MSRSFANWAGLWLVVAGFAVANLVPAAVQAQITFLNTWGSLGSGNTQFHDPTEVAVGPTGTVYVTDFFNSRVQVFNSSGVYESTIGTTGVQGSGNNQFYYPVGVAVGPTGIVYVSDNGLNRVQVFNSAGVYQSTIGSSGSGNNQFNDPLGVAVGPTGTVYVADDANQRVQVFDSSGNYQSTIGTTGSQGSGNNQFYYPVGVAVGPTGTVYVTDQGNQRAQIFDSYGNYQSTIGTTGSEGSGNNQFADPEGVAVGPTGTVYVVDLFNNRVQVFNSSGVYQSTIGSYGSGNNQFNNPEGVAVGPNGMVYVADGGNNRIERFFDPSSWVSGINTFTDPTIGPTSVNVGTGQILGTSLTLTSAMGLVVGAAIEVNSGGFMTQAGGSLSATSGLGVNPGGNFTYQSGSLSIGELAVNGGIFQATQGGQLSAPSGVYIGGTDQSAELLLDGGTSLSCQYSYMQGGLLALGNATFSVTNAAMPFRIYTGEVQLQNANTSVINTAVFENIAGLIDGSGRINGQLVNFLGAQVSVATGQTMTITGAGNANSGLFSLTGGTLHFTQDLTNNSSGAIEGTGTLRLDGGLTNNGTLALAGSSFVFGTVANPSSGIIHLSGNTPNIFFGAVSNSGAINIDAGALGLFYGGVTGSGTITNAGAAQFDATSTASAVSGAGSTSLVSSVTLNANSFTQGGLTLQLAGDTNGTYSKLDVAGALNLAGKLTVSLAGGFTPALGNSFDLLDWGSLSGHFSSLSLPALSSGLVWDTNNLYTTGTLSVIDTQHLPGDVNRDGQVTVADIQSLMVALSDMNAYKAANPDLKNNPQLLLQVLDVNGDGVIDNTDLQALINLVANNAASGGGGQATAVPEPATIVLLGLGALAIALCRRSRSTAGK